MKTCKICKRPLSGDEDMGEVCKHKNGEETNIILNYQNTIEEIEKNFDVADMGLGNEQGLDEIADKKTPPNSGNYMSLFKKATKPEESITGRYWTVKPLLKDLENEGLIRHSAVENIMVLRTLVKTPPTREVLMKLIRDAQK